MAVETLSSVNLKRCRSAEFVARNPLWEAGDCGENLHFLNPPVLDFGTWLPGVPLGCCPAAGGLC